MAVNATAVWRVRPSGSNTNGGGYDPGISGAATDYSQQNSPQASGTNGTASGTTAFSDTTAAAFTSAMVGNALYITGTGLTTGFYFCTAFTDASHITLDRSPGTGTTGTWHLGGGWADFWYNLDVSGNFSSSSNVVAGNLIYILGSGTPNPASYTFDYTGTNYFQCSVQFDQTNGSIRFLNDPNTPGYKASPDTTGGMPCIKAPGLLFYNDQVHIAGLYFVCKTTPENATFGIVSGNGGYSSTAIGCVLDQNAQDFSFIGSQIGGACAIGCEVFSSSAPGSNGVNGAINTSNGSGGAIGCNIHDTVGPGLAVTGSPGFITNNIVAKCRGAGIKIDATGSNLITMVANNTIDDNVGSGIEIVSQAGGARALVWNNIISNHTQAGTDGLVWDAGTAVQNSIVGMFFDYNTFYNNTTNYSGISAGPHDTALSSNPYVGQSTENYTLA